MNAKASSLPLRFVIHHIHPTSARLRFLKSAEAHIIFPRPLPTLSDLLDERDSHNCLAVHPAPFLSQLCETLQMELAKVAIVNEFRQWVDTPQSAIPIYLVKVLTEQPFTAPEGCSWIELPDCFGLIEVERLIMRKVYDFLLGHE